MRSLMLLVPAIALVCQSGADETGPTKCKAEGLHLCCKGCEKSVQQVLEKVRGISEVKVDRGARTVTWQAKNDKAVDAAVSALVDAGFHFAVTIGDKKLDVTSKSTGIKGDELVI